VTVLDLSGQREAGDILLMTGFFDRIPGGVTRYEGFTVQPRP
jgi:hypothetical protein